MFQWLLLILVVVIVAGLYWYLRRQGDGDPWQDMEQPAERDEFASPSEPFPADSGDSYVVGVRTINTETPADRKAAAERVRHARHEQEPDNRTRSIRQPTAVRRRPSASATATRVWSSEAATPAGLKSGADPKPAPETKNKPKPEPEPERAPEPESGSNVRPIESAAAAQPAFQPAAQPAAGEAIDMVAPQPAEDSKIFVLYVVAADGRRFEGAAIHAALAEADLKFGLNEMYHRVTEIHGVTESVFCVTNMLNPGTLDPADRKQLTTSGLALFLLVPGVLEGRPAMRDMMETAHRLAVELGGQVLDDNRSLLKAQTAQYMLDQIADVDRRAQLALRR